MDVPAIELIDVHAGFDGTRVLRGVTLAVPAGRITAMIGPSGVGKTTCVRHMLGLLEPDVGDVLVEGRSLLTMSSGERRDLARRMGVAFQGAGVYGSALWGSLTVYENVAHQLRELVDPTADELHARTVRALREVGLERYAELMPHELSAGQAKRLSLARALAADPEIAILDSFDLGIDGVRLNEVARLIAETQRRRGATYLITTHNIELVRRLADHIIVLWEGRVIRSGDAARVLATFEPEVRQLIDASPEGPLTLASPATERVVATERPWERGYEVPVPLVTLGLLGGITAVVMVLGKADTIPVIVMSALWIIAGALLGIRVARATSSS